MSGRRARGAGHACLLLLVACEHTPPFRPGAYGPAGPAPFAPGRLTFNPGVDWMPDWLPDGSAILYSLQRLDRADRDRCLGVLPAAGGTLRQVLCNTNALAVESTDVFEAAAARGDGRVVYVRASSPTDLVPLTPRHQALVIGTLGHLAAFRVLRTIPYTPPGSTDGRGHEGIAQVRWLGDSAIAYLAERVAYVSPCRGCPPDTLRWGVELATLEWSGDSVTVAVVPGTAEASGLALSVSPDTLYFTRNGDSRVFARARSSGATSVVHDFGPGRIARDVAVHQGRAVAVVGGDVSFDQDPVLGGVQRDGGGQLILVDLVTGAETPLTFSRPFRRPVFSPAGDAVVAEGWDAGGPDLWLVRLP